MIAEYNSHTVTPSINRPVMNRQHLYHRFILTILTVTISFVGNCRLNFYVVNGCQSVQLCPWIKIRNEIIRYRGWEWFFRNFVDKENELYLCIVEASHNKFGAMYMSCNVDAPEVAVEIHRCLNALASNNDTIYICLPDEIVNKKMFATDSVYRRDTLDGFLKNNYWNVVNRLFGTGRCIYNIGSNLYSEYRRLVLLDGIKSGGLVLDDYIMELYHDKCKRSHTNTILNYEEYIKADDSEKEQLLHFINLGDSVIMNQAKQYTVYPLDLYYQGPKEESQSETKMHIIVNENLY